MDEFIKEDFVQIDYLRLIFGVFLLIAQTLIISQFYVKFSKSYNNKLKFSKNLIPFGISILIIVSVIKSSLALSLGLIGALSIIRFRTAIKEPEEIIILLLVMGCAVSIAAEKELLAIILLAFYFISYYFLNRKESDSSNGYKINIKIKPDKGEIGSVISNEFEQNLIYMNKSLDDYLNLVYRVQSKEQLDSILKYYNELNNDYAFETSTLEV
ncbi:DUF4956 domain-containing protein [Robiginitalea sp. IMCC43444]|uniref:DUF4956 domain-containing protein n=1 Tax=Robiginitalea sp. IMCC43444 TaxID=3459121 RepID=UPI00404290ED